MHFLSNNPYLFLILGSQIFCVVHIIRNQKSFWWIPFILLFAPLSCIWYFFREVHGRGSSSGPGRKKLVNQNPGKLKVNASLIRSMEDELKYKDTVALRTKIAEAHLELGNTKEAAEYFRSCMKGFHKDDPPILFGLARAEYACSEFDEALKHLKTMDDNGNQMDFITDRRHLQARCHEALGNLDKAREIYKDVFNRISGEEARCDYAQLLEKIEEAEEARKLYEIIVENGKRGDNLFRGRNKQWIDIASDRLKALS